MDHASIDLIARHVEQAPDLDQWLAHFAIRAKPGADLETVCRGASAACGAVQLGAAYTAMHSAVFDPQQHPHKGKGAAGGQFTKTPGGDGPQTAMGKQDAAAKPKVAKKPQAPWDDDGSDVVIPHNSLNVPRDQMPQIPSDQTANFLAELRNKGVQVDADTVRVGDLKPIQGELSKEQMAFIKELPPVKRGKPLLVSQDGYILDGHHRWGALVAENPDHEIAAYIVDLPMQELLKAGRDFQGAKFKPSPSAAKPAAQPIKLSAWQESKHKRGGKDNKGEFTAQPQTAMAKAEADAKKMDALDYSSRSQKPKPSNAPQTGMAQENADAVQQDAPPAAAGGAPAPAGPRPVFTPEELALPKDAVQPIAPNGGYAALAGPGQVATQQMQQLLDLGKGVGAQLGYTTHQPKSEEEFNQLMDQPGGMVILAPMKGEKRATEKVNSDYGGDWSKLLDVARASIVVDSYDDVEKAVAKLRQNGTTFARKPKDRMTTPTDAGYRDILTNVKLPNGIVGELQILVKPMMKAKLQGHHQYEISRSIEAQAQSEGRDKSTLREHAEYQRAMMEMRHLYDSAWEKCGGPKGVALSAAHDVSGEKRDAAGQWTAGDSVSTPVDIPAAPDKITEPDKVVALPGPTPQALKEPGMSDQSTKPVNLGRGATGRNNAAYIGYHGGKAALLDGQLVGWFPDQASKDAFQASHWARLVTGEGADSKTPLDVPVSTGPLSAKAYVPLTPAQEKTRRREQMAALNAGADGGRR